MHRADHHFQRSFMSLVNNVLHALARRTDKKKHFTSAIILAAGSGSRMGTKTTKQMLVLEGIPVVVRSISAFEKSEYIDEIIIAAREEEMASYKRFSEEYGFCKVKAVVKGGDTRQESVFRALRKLSTACEYIAIHDGARPLVTGENIADTVKAAYKYNCACAAYPAKDTVKLASALGYIEQTPDRSRVWCALTPQVFRAEIYRAAAYTAKKDGVIGTDDCSLVEGLGFRIKLIDCGYENIKITTQDDLVHAQAILQKRSAQ